MSLKFSFSFCLFIIAIIVIISVSHNIRYIDFASIDIFDTSIFEQYSIPSSINDVDEYIIIVAIPIPAIFKYFLNSSNVLFLFFTRNSMDIAIANIWYTSVPINCSFCVNSLNLIV